eukprot:9186981-Alexandrium_andersonii.AAC.1
MSNYAANEQRSLITQLNNARSVADSCGSAELITHRSLLSHAANELRANCRALAIALVTQRICPSKPRTP